MAGCTNVGADAQIDTLFPAEILGDLVDKVKGKAVSDAGAIDGGALSAMLMRAMGDESPQVRAAAVAVGEWADASALVPMLQKYLDTDGNGETDTDRADRTAASIARTLGKIAGKQGDADKATDTVNRLASLLACPTDDVQTAAAEGIASAVRVLPGDRGKEILDHYLADIGGANARASGYGLAAAVKGMRSKSLLGHGVLESLVVALADKKNQEKRAGACVATECLMRVLVHIFEPYAAKIMPAIIKATGDKVTEVRSAADAALSAIVRLCSPHALAVYIPIMATVKHESPLSNATLPCSQTLVIRDALNQALIMSVWVQVLCDRSSTWQSKVACLQKFQAQSELSGKQVGQLMDVMVPAVIESLTDTKPEVIARPMQ
jgi:HEAT repeat protein